MADYDNFWRGRRVLVTGHTGFKGAWLALWLEHLGAEVCGYALAPEAGPNLFEDLADWRGLSSIIGDIRDRDALAIGCVFADPDVVFHLAAQSLVRRGHADPQTTFSTNVQGTATLLDALDECPALRAMRQHYNRFRPHSALGYRPPAPEAIEAHHREWFRSPWGWRRV